MTSNNFYSLNTVIGSRNPEKRVGRNVLGETYWEIRIGRNVLGETYWEKRTGEQATCLLCSGDVYHVGWLGWGGKFSGIFLEIFWRLLAKIQPEPPVQF